MTIERHWTPRRKAEVLQQIADNELGLSEAVEKYGMTFEELLGWQELFKVHGIKGLRTTRLHDYLPGRLRQRKKRPV